MQIDILLATYNGARFLAEQLDSLFNQTNQDWTLIVHDDGSMDETVEIVKSYQVRNPSRIVLIEDDIKTGGAKNNFSHLIQFSISEYVMFCDQDDVWLSNKIELTLNQMLKLENTYPNKPILVHTDLVVVDKKLNEIAPSMFNYQKISKSPSFEELLVQNNVTGCTMMINKKAREDSLPIPKDAIMHDWWIALISMANRGHVALLDKPTILYRQHQSNSVGAQKVSLLFFLQKFFRASKQVCAIYRQAYLIKPRPLFLIILKKGMLLIGKLF